MFLRTHMIISIILGVMIWVHLWWPKELIEIVLVVGTSCFVASFILRYVLQIFRNTSVRKLEITRLTGTQPFGDCMVVSLMVPHAWTIEPGQYVYLTLLTTRALSFAQRHPFVITWWDAEPGSTSSKTLYLMLNLAMAGVAALYSIRINYATLPPGWLAPLVIAATYTNTVVCFSSPLERECLQSCLLSSA